MKRREKISRRDNEKKLQLKEPIEEKKHKKQRKLGKTKSFTKACGWSEKDSVIFPN